MVLEVELKYYLDQKVELLTHYKGQFALIKDAGLEGTFTTHEEAFSAGVEKFGNVPFLIQHIQEEDEFIQHPSLTVGLISAHP